MPLLGTKYQNKPIRNCCMTQNTKIVPIKCKNLNPETEKIVTDADGVWSIPLGNNHTYYPVIRMHRAF
jgi:hypothetical protein